MIDSSLFGVDIPAGTYAVGDVINLGIISGPEYVRPGRGTATLKTVTVGRFGTGAPNWRIHVKNNNWIDDMQSFVGRLTGSAALMQDSGLISGGDDAVLVDNSRWTIYIECIEGGTSTAAESVFCLIDIDYSADGSVTDPNALQGVPASIGVDFPNGTINATGTITAASWLIQNVNYFKSGFEYCLQNVELVSDSALAYVVGFVAFSNGGSMNGLSRIIPVLANYSSGRWKITHAAVQVLGPMDFKVMLFGPTAGTANVYTVHDYVRRV